MYISNALKAIPVKQRFVYDREVDREVEAHLTLITADGECDLDYFVSWLHDLRGIPLSCIVKTVCCRFRAGLRGRSISVTVKIAVVELKQWSAASPFPFLHGLSVVAPQRSIRLFIWNGSRFSTAYCTRQASKLSGRSCLPTIRAVEHPDKARAAQSIKLVADPPV